MTGESSQGVSFLHRSTSGFALSARLDDLAGDYLRILADAVKNC